MTFDHIFTAEGDDRHTHTYFHAHSAVCRPVNPRVKASVFVKEGRAKQKRESRSVVTFLQILFVARLLTFTAPGKCLCITTASAVGQSLIRVKLLKMEENGK